MCKRFQPQVQFIQGTLLCVFIVSRKKCEIWKALKKVGRNIQPKTTTQLRSFRIYLLILLKNFSTENKSIRTGMGWKCICKEGTWGQAYVVWKLRLISIYSHIYFFKMFEIYLLIMLVVYSTLYPQRCCITLCCSNTACFKLYFPNVLIVLRRFQSWNLGKLAGDPINEQNKNSKHRRHELVEKINNYLQKTTTGINANTYFKQTLLAKYLCKKDPLLLFSIVFT